MRRPRVKSAHQPVLFPDGRIRFSSPVHGIAAELQDDAQRLIWRLLRLLDGSRTVADVVTEMGRQVLDLDETSVRVAIDQLAAAGLIEDAGGEIPFNLSDSEIARYVSNTDFFACVDDAWRSSPYEMQSRLKAASVAVLGVGGIGCAVAASLVAVGVGRLRCGDQDLVEESNLTRQLLYTEADVGRSKVAVAAKRLAELNSNVAVEPVNLCASGVDDLVAFTDGCDLLVLCADHPRPDIQLWANEAALRTATPWIECGYFAPVAVTGLFVPGRTPCYRCYQATLAGSCIDEDGRHGELLLAPTGNAVICPTANLSGHLTALEAVRFLAGQHPRSVGRMLYLNLIQYEVVEVVPRFWRDCLSCGPHPNGAPAIHHAPVGLVR